VIDEAVVLVVDREPVHQAAGRGEKTLVAGLGGALGALGGVLGGLQLGGALGDAALVAYLFKKTLIKKIIYTRIFNF
jgi:hypothetical protein